MNCHKIDFEKTNRFSAFFLDYIKNTEKVKSYFDLYPKIENFKKQIDKKKNFPHRNTLVKVLKQQYQDLKTGPKVKTNIDSLASEKTFTVTTGHQLNIFTGPLYFIYKIITVINTCKKLKEEYPEYNFIPVYWMATEDHDFEEINHLRFNGKWISWETDQKGAVGHFDPSEIRKLFSEIPGLPDFFQEAYNKRSLAEAVRFYVNHLFSTDGLVVLDADHPSLKGLFREVIKDDILNHTAKNIVSQQLDALDKNNYEVDIFPREINFFYLENKIRERIEKENGRFKVLGTDLSFTENEILQLIHDHPERFSPNVILRPLYEETILPNLAYVGGPAEVVYWLPLKPVFEKYDIPFPLVMPRNFAMVIQHNVQKKIEKTGFRSEDLFQKRDVIVKQAVMNFADHDIQLNGQIEKLESLFDQIKDQAKNIDPTLAPHVEAQMAKTKKRLEIIEKKFIRAEKRNQEDKLRQVESVIDYLFPNGSLQERTDNFLNFYIGNADFINDLKECFDPFDYRFHILNYGK